MVNNGNIILKSRCNDLVLLLILKFRKEGMMKQLFNTRSFSWIFLQTFVQEVPYFVGHIQIRRYFNLILYYLNQFFLFRYFKGILTNHHLIHHNSYRPNIYLLIILSPLEDLRAHVEWSATESSPEFVILMH